MLGWDRPGLACDLLKRDARLQQRGVPFELFTGLRIQRSLSLRGDAISAQKRPREVGAIPFDTDGIGVEAHQVSCRQRSVGAFLEVWVGARAALEQPAGGVLALAGDEAAVECGPHLRLGCPRHEHLLHLGDGQFGAAHHFAHEVDLDRQLVDASGHEHLMRIGEREAVSTHLGDGLER